MRHAGITDRHTLHFDIVGGSGEHAARDVEVYATREEIEQLATQGYLLRERLFPQEEVERLREAVAIAGVSAEPERRPGPEPERCPEPEPRGRPEPEERPRGWCAVAAAAAEPLPSRFGSFARSLPETAMVPASMPSCFCAFSLFSETKKDSRLFNAFSPAGRPAALMQVKRRGPGWPKAFESRARAMLP